MSRSSHPAAPMALQPDRQVIITLVLIFEANHPITEQSQKTFPACNSRVAKRRESSYGERNLRDHCKRCWREEPTVLL
jgi:hypothetical protein